MKIAINRIKPLAFILIFVFSSNCASQNVIIEPIKCSVKNEIIELVQKEFQEQKKLEYFVDSKVLDETYFENM
jgi:hypothetical protein